MRCPYQADVRKAGFDCIFPFYKLLKAARSSIHRLSKTSFVLRSHKLVRSTCPKSNQYKIILSDISHIFLTFSGGVVLTSIIINLTVLANSPSYSVLNLANCEGIEALNLGSP